MNNKLTGFLLGLIVLATAGFAQDYRLLLQSGTVQPVANLSEFIEEASPTDIFNGYYYRFLQFKNIPTQEEKNTLTASGIKLLDYIPKNTFVAAIPERYNRAKLASFGVRSVIKQDAIQKINFRILGEFPAHAVNERGTVDLVVQYHRNIPSDLIYSTAPAFGKILKQDPDNRTITVRISDKDLMKLASLPWVFYINTITPPSTPDDFKGRSLHRSNLINTNYATGRHYDGSGVTVAIADDGIVGPHIDFTGRLTNFATAAGGFHGDMCSGIYVGAGNLNPTMQGMASGAYLYTYDIDNYVHITDAVSNFNTLQTVITSTSYSQGCNEYTVETQAGDQTLNQNKQLAFVFSAGNNGGGNCSYGAGAGWGNITGGYKQGKNVIACGNLDAMEVLDPSSSRGPASDGRIKPDICANGRDQMTTDENNTYQVGGGTSAASPGIAGITAQLYQAYKELNGGVNPQAALIKACMLNSAEDIGNPGPDFTYGWGRVNAYRALLTLEDNRYILDSVSQGQTNTHTIAVPANVRQVRVMLYWNDPEGSPVASQYLVNDLNSSLTDPSSVSWNPWVLDPTPSASALNTHAVRDIDFLNNMEQVTLDNPAAGNYTFTVNGTTVPSGVQEYFVVYEFRTDEITVIYPSGGEGFVPGESEVLRWDAFKDNTQDFTIEYSIDSGSTWLNLVTLNGTILQHIWTVPNNITGTALVKITRGSSSDVSDHTFSIIGTPDNITVDWACPDSVHLSWDAEPNATGYTIYKLGATSMDSIGYSSTNEFTATGINPNFTDWFSVSANAAVTTTGRRANAIFKPSGTFNCPLAIDAQAVSLLSPSSGNLQDCQDNSAVGVSVMLENKGQNAITNIPVELWVNGILQTTETANTTLNPGDDMLFTFTSTVDLSVIGVYDILVIAKYPGDLNTFNDSLTASVNVIAGVTATLPVTEDFETFVTCDVQSNCGATICPLGNGWSNYEDDDHDFRVNSGSTPSADTGPDADHTSGTGNYIYLEASGGCTQQEAILISPCIDLTSASAPQLIFWRHMYGANMGSLHVDVYAEGSWTLDVMPPLSGNAGNQWLQSTVNLVSFAGEIINIRFRAITGIDFDSDLALDDISIIESNAPPVASFTASSNSGCVGETITLTDVSLNAPNSWQWNITPSTFVFVNGTSATSANPQIQFTATGTYDIELIAGNAFGSSSVTQAAYISIPAALALPSSEDFESGAYPPANWKIASAGGAITWDEANVTGSTNLPTTAAWVNNFNYNNVGAEDGLVTPEFDLNGISNPELRFDVAYAQYNSTFTDGMRIDISTDCGATYTPTGYLKMGTVLATAPDNQNAFAPSSSSEWRRDNVDLSTWSGQEVKLKFVNINGYGNNLYIDNINVDQATSVEENSASSAGILVYPNPGQGIFHIYSVDNIQPNEITVTDIRGRNIEVKVNGSGNTLTADLSSNAAGVYILKINNEKGTRSYRLTIL